MEEMTVEEVVGRLKAHEGRLKGQIENSGGQLLFTQEEWSKRSKGCLAYMKIPSVHVKKLDDRSKPVVYLGKEPCSKAHRLYDPSSKTVHVSRDVEFEESEGWAWHVLQTKENQNTGSFVIVDTGGNIVETGKEQEVSASTPPGSPS